MEGSQAHKTAIRDLPHIKGAFLGVPLVRKQCGIFGSTLGSAYLGKILRTAYVEPLPSLFMTLFVSVFKLSAAGLPWKLGCGLGFRVQVMLHHQTLALTKASYCRTYPHRMASGYRLASTAKDLHQGRRSMYCFCILVGLREGRPFC